MKFIIATHGDFGKGILSSLNMLLGPQENIEAYGLYPEQEAARLGEQLAQAIDAEPAGSVVFFTDLYFGSPFNQVVELARTRDIYHVTGVNLPVLIEATVARNSGATPDAICDIAIKAAEGSVMDVRKMLATQDVTEEEEEW